MFPTPHRDRVRLSYANVTATLALFIALGGTAAAAVTLDRDSVGSPQIRKDAVRAPEIADDAVRSPEIASGAVRSSEIRDGAIKATDISTGARPKLLGALRAAEDDNERFLSVPTCDGADLSTCPNQLTLRLASGTASSRQTAPPPTLPGGSSPGPQVPEAAKNWLIQAKLHVFVDKGTNFNSDRCGLVNTSAPAATAVLDQVPVGLTQGITVETIALSAIVTKQARNPPIALRCTRQAGDRVEPTRVKLTALEVGIVTAP